MTKYSSIVTVTTPFSIKIRWSFLLTLILLPLAIATADPNEIQAPPSIRVTTFNVFYENQERLSRIQAGLLALRNIQADVIALQEVATGWLHRGNLLDVWPTALEMHETHAWHKNWVLFKEGLAILSRFQILDSNYSRFRKFPFANPRGYLRAKIRTPYGDMQFINVHLASTQSKTLSASEFEELTEVVLATRAEGLPVILLGDFNQTEASPAFQNLIHQLGAQSLYHAKSQKPLDWQNTWSPDYRKSCNDPSGARIDHIFIIPPSPLKFKSGKIVVSQTTPHPSDHCAVYADLQPTPKLGTP